jgi:outer membrane receptor protein involved in Fe transport
LVYAFNDRTSFKTGYSRSSQFLHLLSTSTSGSPLDIWMPSNPNIKPQTANQFSAGVFRNFLNDEYETSLEGYYKNYFDVIDFKDHPDVFARDAIEPELRTGGGKSYGLEMMIRKNSGKLTGWLSYTLSRTLRTLDSINGGRTYSSPYDKPHNVNLVLNYELSSRLSLGLVWVYSSGQPVTFPEGRYMVGEDYIPIYSGRNTYRMPAYHRMDASATFNLDKRKNKRWKNELNVSIYNLYGRKNPWMINFHTDAEGEQYAEMTYLFRIVPSITYNFKF